MADQADQTIQDDSEKPEMDMDSPDPSKPQQSAATISGMSSDAPGSGTTGGLQSPKSGPAPKKAKNSRGILEIKVPLARVKRIMKLDKDVKLISTDAAHLACKATELFLEYLTTEAFKRAQQGNRKGIQYRDLAAAVHDIDVFEFLTDLMPLNAPPPEVAVEKKAPASHDKPTQAPVPSPMPAPSQRTLSFAPVPNNTSSS